MKQTDIDRLKEICKKEGYDFEYVSQFFHISKKDVWEGVEFYKSDSGVYKIICYEADYYGRVKICNTNGKWILKEDATPSTEQEYVDQLKKEAFERFGEIKDGDRFDRTGIDVNWTSEKIKDSELNFNYRKSNDTLYFGSLGIYQSGKWAKKLPERIEVEWDGGNIQDKSFYFIYDKSVQEKLIKVGFSKVGKFLAKKLEEYLNNEK